MGRPAKVPQSLDLERLAEVSVLGDDFEWCEVPSYTVEKTSGRSLGFSLEFGRYVALEPEVSPETIGSGIQRIDYRMDAGYPFFVNRSSGSLNGVQCTFQENSIQESGIPRVTCTAALVQPYNNYFGGFETTIRTTSHVSFMQDAKRTLKRALGKIPVDDPVVFDLKRRAKVLHGGVILFEDKSDDFEKVENPLDFKT